MKTRRRNAPMPRLQPLCQALLAAGLLLTGIGLPVSGHSQSLPQGGTITGGSGNITSPSSTRLVIQQTSPTLSLDWQGFNIGAGHSVRFDQPSASAAVLNRVVGGDPSTILGSLQSNGRVFLVNPAGITFAPGAQVDVGSLVASTLEISKDDFHAGRTLFDGNSTQAIINHGNIRSGQGGVVALIAARVDNRGNIIAPGGQVALAAGERVRLNLGGPLQIEIDRAALDALISQSGAIQADGGRILMNARAAGDLLSLAINHSGISQARSLVTGAKGEILLVADLAKNSIQVGGQLDASAPNGGDGGFIDTSAAKVHVSDTLQVSTAAPHGRTGTWLIDPTDYTIAASGGDITGAALSAQLANNNITLQTPESGAGNGDIFINDAISWGASTTLTLSAHRDVSFGANITKNAGSGDAGLLVRAGRSIINTGTRSISATSGKLHVKLNSDADNTGGGAIALDNVSIATNGGNLSMGGGTLASQQAINAAYSQADYDNASVALLDSAKGLSGRVSGISLSTGTYNSGTGNLTLSGKGWDAGAAGVKAHTNHGVVINANTSVQSTDGSVSVSGTGGNGTSSNYGVWLNGTNALITSVNGAVTVNGTGGNGTSHSNFGTVLSSGGQITSTGSATLNISGSGGNGTNDNYGVRVNGSNALITSANGEVTVNGTGGNGTSYSNFGTVLSSGGQITSTGSATLNISGTGGNGTSGNLGVHLWGTNTRITSGTGAVSVNGTGGNGTGGSNIGTCLDSGGQITSTGIATLNISGTGGNGTDGNYGVYVSGTNARITSANGAVSVNGRGGNGSGSFNHGTYVVSGGQITSTGSATLNITGTGGNGTTNNHGVHVVGTGGSLITSTNGAIMVNGIGGNGTSHSNFGTYLLNGGQISSGASGNALTVVNIGSFINSTGSTALSTPHGRWLVYSSNPANDTLGGLSSGFRRFSCNYAGSCPSFPATGNGLLYSFTPTLTITPASLASALTYGDAAPSLANYAYSVSGYLDNDASADTLSGSLNGTTAYSQGSNVGTYSINYSSGALTSAMGYGFTYANNTSAITVNPRTLTAALTGSVSKTYDRTTTATLAAGNYSLSNIYGSDDVALSNFSAGTYNNANVGSNKTVSVSGLSLSGAKAGNYILSSSSLSAAIGSISPREVTVSGMTAQNKTYDGTTAASLNTNTATLSGWISGDSLSVSATGSFESRHAGSNKTVNLSGFSLQGADAGNYTLAASGQQATTSADIARASITVSGITAQNKTYDGNTAASLNTNTATLSGWISGDNLSVSATGSFESRHAGSNKTVNLSGFSLQGTDAGNYTLAASGQQATTSADIARATVTVSGITAQNKTYDGTTAASLVTSAATLAGRVGSDDLGVSATGSFDDRNIGRGKTVMLFNLGLHGADAGNYTLAASGQQATTSADILQDPQSAAAIPTLPSSAFSKALPQGQLSNSSCREKRHGLLRNKRDDCLETLWIDQKLW